MSKTTMEGAGAEILGDEPFSHAAATSMAAYILQEQWRYKTPQALNAPLYAAAERRQGIFVRANLGLDADRSNLAMIVNATRIAHKYLNQHWREEVFRQDKLVNPIATMSDVPNPNFRLCLPPKFVELPDEAREFLHDYFIWQDAQEQVAS